MRRQQGVPASDDTGGSLFCIRLGLDLRPGLKLGPLQQEHFRLVHIGQHGLLRPLLVVLYAGTGGSLSDLGRYPCTVLNWDDKVTAPCDGSP